MLLLKFTASPGLICISKLLAKLASVTKKCKNDWFNWRIIPSRSSVRAGATVQSHPAVDFPKKSNCISQFP